MNIFTVIPILLHLLDLAIQYEPEIKADVNLIIKAVRDMEVKADAIRKGAMEAEGK